MLSALTSEFHALRVDEPYMSWSTSGVTLFPDLAFLPKVASEFACSQPMVFRLWAKNKTLGLDGCVSVGSSRCMWSGVVLYGWATPGSYLSLMAGHSEANPFPPDVFLSGSS